MAVNTNTWNPKTKEGKEHVDALLELLKAIKYREDLLPALKVNVDFRDVSCNAVHKKLSDEQLIPESELGLLWKNISRKPNLLFKLFPDEKMHAELADDFRIMSVVELRKKYPALEQTTPKQRYAISQLLGVKRPSAGWNALQGKKNSTPVLPVKEAVITSRNWWTFWSSENVEAWKTELLTDWRSDYHVAGQTNLDLFENKWKARGCPTEEGLKYAARAFGETKSRLQIGAEYKTTEEAERAIADRLGVLIRDGILMRSGVEDIYDKVRGEFSLDPAYARYSFSQEKFLELLDGAVWTSGQQGTLVALKEFVLSGTPLEKFHKHHPYIPFVRVKAKAQELTGETNLRHPVNFEHSRAVPGVLRFLGEGGMKGGEDFKLPPSGPRDPYDTGIVGRNWKIRILNAPNLGLLHERLIEVNPPRLSLAQAQYEGFNGVTLTNAFSINTNKAAGPSRVLRALFEGLQVDEDDVTNIFDPSYQEKVLRIIRENPDDEVFYETHEEMLKDLVSALHKIGFRPDGTLEYSGPIYYILGMPEESVIVTAAYWHVHYVTRLKQSDIRVERKAAESALAATMSEINSEALDIRREIKDARKRLELEIDEQAREELSRIVDGLEMRLADLISEEELVELEEEEKEVQDLRAEEVRTRISTVATQEWKRFYQKALAGFVRLVESALPNCKVVGKGTTYLKVGSKRIEINIPGNERVTDSHLSAYTNVYGGKVLRGEMADAVVICPQWSLNPSLTAREVDNDGARGSTVVRNAPMCVNADYLRGALKTVVRKGSHPIGSAVYSEQCQTGVLDLISTEDVVTTNYVSIPALASHEKMQAHLFLPPVRREKNKLIGKVIRILVATDQHWGSQAKEFIFCPECCVNLGMVDSLFHMWRKAGYGNGAKLPPIHMYTANDDLTQGHHFPAEEQPHPHELLYPDIEKLLRASLEEFRKTRNLPKRVALEEQLIKKLLYQFLVRGVYCTTNQMMLLLRQHLQPNIDMYDGILRRAVESRLILRGISEFQDRSRVVKDSRDVAFIFFGTGNHFLSTTEGRVSEGPIYAELLKAHLLQYPYWQERAELVEKYVRGPVYGKEFISFGTVQAPGGYEWGLDFRNTPPGRGVDWGNPLSGCSKNDLRRGNYSRIFGRKVTIKTYGDKHFLSNIITSNAIYLMGPASTHTDVYGELGFAPNSTGVVFLDIPAEGPDAGPISIRQLLYDDIKRLVEGDWRTFDWEAFLPNAL